MKTIVIAFAAIMGLTLIVLAGFGIKKAGSEAFRAFEKSRDPRPANVIELTPTVVSSDGTVSQFVPQRNETEIELPNMVVKGSTTSCEKE